MDLLRYLVKESSRNPFKKKELSYMIADYYNFLVYCKKRKTFCRGYHRLKRDRFLGYIDQHSYVKSLRKIHKAALELELDYFDILHMRL